jgi:hypothetical protein
MYRLWQALGLSCKVLVIARVIVYCAGKHTYQVHRAITRHTVGERAPRAVESASGFAFSRLYPNVRTRRNLRPKAPLQYVSYCMWAQRSIGPGVGDLRLSSTIVRRMTSAMCHGLL